MALVKVGRILGFPELVFTNAAQRFAPWNYQMLFWGHPCLDEVYAHFAWHFAACPSIRRGLWLILGLIQRFQPWEALGHGEHSRALQKGLISMSQVMGSIHTTLRVPVMVFIELNLDQVKRYSGHNHPLLKARRI